MKKYNHIKLIAILLLLTLIFTGCKSNSKIEELKKLCFTYEELCERLTDYFDNGVVLNKENATFILKYTESFESSVQAYSDNNHPNYYNRISDETNILTELGSYISDLNKILRDIIKNPENSEKDFTYFSSCLNHIHNSMISLEHRRIISSEEIITDYIKYFMIFIIFFLVLCGVLLVIFILELKQKELKLIETSDFLNYTIKGQEEEKRHIARELHDTVAQDIRYIIQLTKKIDASNLQKDILSKEEKCLQQVRDICTAFIPQDIENKDLAASLNDIINTIETQNNIEVKLTILDNINFKNMTSENFLHFYRIIQEILNNAQKHSQATEISILIKKETKEEGNFIHLIITDDGIGIDKQILESIKEQKITVSKKHFGLRNIIQRVNLLKGQIDFTSDKDFGTEISVLIPE